MANFVIKKDGTKVAFDANKIRNAIAAAARGAGLAEEDQAGIINRVSGSVIQSLVGQEEVATAEIKQKILNELDATAPAVSASWRAYDQQKAK